MNECQKKMEEESVIYVNNLPSNVTEDEVRKVFCKYGNVLDMYFVRKPRYPICMCFITYDNHMSARTAAAELDFTDFRGMQLKVQITKKSTKSRVNTEKIEAKIQEDNKREREKTESYDFYKSNIEVTPNIPPPVQKPPPKPKVDSFAAKRTPPKNPYEGVATSQFDRYSYYEFGKNQVAPPLPPNVPVVQQQQPQINQATIQLQPVQETVNAAAIAAIPAAVITTIPQDPIIMQPAMPAFAAPIPPPPPPSSSRYAYPPRPYGRGYQRPPPPPPPYYRRRPYY